MISVPLHTFPLRRLILDRDQAGIPRLRSAEVAARCTRTGRNFFNRRRLADYRFIRRVACTASSPKSGGQRYRISAISLPTIRPPDCRPRPLPDHLCVDGFAVIPCQ